MAGTAGLQRNANLERPGPHCADIGSSQRMDTVCTIVVNELVFKSVLYSREGYIGASKVDRMDDLIIYGQISEHFFFY